MSSPRPFRFGVQASGSADRSQWVDLARRSEALGYDVLTMPDHFTEQLAPVPALMCAADATSTLRIGALVWDNDYKHPVVLAKELATSPQRLRPWPEALAPTEPQRATQRATRRHRNAPAIMLRPQWRPRALAPNACNTAEVPKRCQASINKKSLQHLS